MGYLRIILEYKRYTKYAVLFTLKFINHSSLIINKYAVSYYFSIALSFWKKRYVSDWLL